MSDPVKVDSTKSRSRFRPILRLALIAFVGIGLVLLGWSLQPSTDVPESLLEPTLKALSTELAAAQIDQQAPATALATNPPAEPTAARQLESVNLPIADQVVVFTAFQDGFQHLRMTVPGSLTSVALTAGSFDDADPALSVDGSKIAFRSNRDGNWELYLLELASGEIRRLTNTPGYEGHPTWSPDGRWLAYEAYREGDLDIWIMSLEQGRTPIQLTNHIGLDAAPTWDPAGGRQIAFLSDRHGSIDLFLANLDLPENRFSNLTQSPEWDERAPAFSPNGQELAYSTEVDGLELVWTLSFDDSDELPRQIGTGRSPTWSPGGGGLAVVQEDAHSQRVLTYDFDGRLPGLGLVQQGPPLQLSWGLAGSDDPVVAVEQDPRPLAVLPTEINSGGLGRRSLIDMSSIDSIDAKLIESAQEPFEQLRAATARRVGWDFLESLEAAYVGLNDPLPPGFAYNDWLYTGRAFAFESRAIESGWVEVVPEDFGGKRYWRVFVRAAKQDGSLGAPLLNRPWDFSARYSGDPSDYDQGGALQDEIPQGYYVDFTGLAEAFGFRRQPALNNWRTFYPGARFNVFAYTEGLDWRSAMLQLYPQEAIATPTAFSSPTPTPTITPWPTPTPWWLRWRTATPVPTDTPIPPPTASSTP